MGMFNPSPKTGNIDIPPPHAHPSTLGSVVSSALGTVGKQKAAAAEGLGMDNTVQTTQQGLKDKPDTAKATLLGQ